MMGIKYVYGTPTSLNGCKVEIDGDVEQALIASRIAGFHGTVHLSGGQDCPNGDLYFGIEPKGRAAPILPGDE